MSEDVSQRVVAAKKTVEDIDVDGKTVLVRTDFNVPFRPGTTEISDDSRIESALPTIRYLTERRCRVVLCSHLGRPEGRVADELRMGPVADRLSELLGARVLTTDDCVGPHVADAVASLRPGGVLLLENVRFHSGEEENSSEFASALAAPADVYVDDAFGAAHRSHASIDGVALFLPAVSGLLVARELEVLSNALERPRRPFVAILGGAKVSDKLAALENLASKVDVLLVGGGMAATFFAAQGLAVGESLVEPEQFATARAVLSAATESRLDVRLPVDVVTADSFSADARHQVVDADQVPPGYRIMDIGPRTTEAFERKLEDAYTIIWNGPMGVAEWKAFSEGTRRLAAKLAALQNATTIIGGGSTAEAVRALGLDSAMTHVSTGGGASLDFIGGKTLPGVAALLDKD